jgi:hypothetical protein
MAKWLIAYTEDEKTKVIEEVHALVTIRESGFTNFIEVTSTVIYLKVLFILLLIFH